VTPYSLVELYLPFEVKCCLHLQGRRVNVRRTFQSLFIYLASSQFASCLTQTTCSIDFWKSTDWPFTCDPGRCNVIVPSSGIGRLILWEAGYEVVWLCIHFFLACIYLLALFSLSSSSFSLFYSLLSLISFSYCCFFPHISLMILKVTWLVSRGCA
jgi:hypothetical protein